jgi:hypothetical protein
MGKLMLNDRPYTGGGQGNTNYVGGTTPSPTLGDEHDAYYKINSEITEINYIRLSISEVRDNPQIYNVYTQLSEIRLKDASDNYYSWSGATIVCNKNIASTSESANNLLDGSTATKCNVRHVPSEADPVIFDITLASAIDLSVYNVWEWYTANDANERDPISWKLYVSSNGASWILLDSQTAYATTTTRQALAYSKGRTAPSSAEITNKYLKIDNIWIEDSTGGGGGSAGGHTIVDENGTSYAQEPNLQFVGTKVSDDSANNKTVVTVFEHKTKAQWEAMTPQEQADGNFIVSGLGATGDLKNNYVSFTSGDSADSDATSWTSVQPMANTDIFSVLFNKISTMAKNARYLKNTLAQALVNSQWIDITSELTFASFCTYKKAIYNPLTKEVRIHITTVKSEAIGNAQTYVTISNSAYKANTSLLATITSGSSYICGIASARYTQSPSQASNIYPFNFVMAYHPSATNDTIIGTYPISANAYTVLMNLSYFTN